MKKLILMLACLAPLLATAQEKPGVTAIAPVDRSIPASAVDADGMYIEYAASAWDGKKSLELGSYLSASECTHRLEQAFASPEFSDAIHRKPILQLACVATRQKA
ncbi:hypothetical protein bAD24_p00895 (plasmid) [Burkholderia sp. AD24]|nr:hypothetical protein bAD24_p00895 [Burkholderia sp. AD24]